MKWICFSLLDGRNLRSRYLEYHKWGNYIHPITITTESESSSINSNSILIKAQKHFNSRIREIFYHGSDYKAAESCRVSGNSKKGSYSNEINCSNFEISTNFSNNNNVDLEDETILRNKGIERINQKCVTIGLSFETSIHKQASVQEHGTRAAPEETRGGKCIDF